MFQLGGLLDLVYSDLLPEDKAQIVKEFQQESPTAMIGDGLNDAAALATADIGISMGISGSALAMETGNIILMSNDIRRIPQAVGLAKKTQRKIFQNIFLSIITKAAIIALAIAGHPLVWAAVLADVGTCLLVIFNSMLLLGSNSTRMKKRSKSSDGHEHVHKGSHGHKNCCSSEKVDKICLPNQKCSSGPCTSNKCNTSLLSEKHGCCGSHGDEAKVIKSDVVVAISELDAENCHKRCCSPQVHQVDSSSSCAKSLGEIKCDEPIENHGGCQHDEKPEEKKHVGAGSCAADQCVKSVEEGHGHVHSHSHSHSHDHHGHGHHVHDHHEHDHCHHDHDHNAHNHDDHDAHDVHHQHEHDHDHDHGHTHHHDHDDEHDDEHDDSNHVECTFQNVCSSMERRHIGGCCHSFRRECCGNISPHFGGGFGRNLSEIIIE